MKKVLAYIMSLSIIFSTIIPPQVVFAEHAAASYSIPAASIKRKPTPHYTNPHPVTHTGPYVPTKNYTANHTGWRCYVVDETGHLESSVWDLMFSAELFDGSFDGTFLSTRIGGGETSQWKAVLSGMPKPTSSDPAAWFRGKDASGNLNAVDLIAYCWGEGMVNEFRDTTRTMYLCVEPVLYHKFSTEPEWKNFLLYASGYEWLKILESCGININSYVYRTVHGKTVPIKSTFGDKSWLGLNRVDSDVSRVIGGHFLSASDIDAGNFAYCIMAYRNTDLFEQSTWDDVSSIPSKPPKESEGRWYIHKTYRTKVVTPTGIDYTGDGQFTQPSVKNIISVEEETLTQYKVVGWKTSTSTPVTLDYNTWNVPAVVQQNTTANRISTVEMNQYGPEQTLFVLLEKDEVIPPEDPTADYVLEESQITKGIDIDESESGSINGRNIAQDALSNLETGDNRWTGTGRIILSGYKFIWQLHSMTCHGHRYSYVSGHNDDGSEIHSSATAYCKLYLTDRHLNFDVINKFRNNYPKNLAVEAWKDWTSPGVRSGQDKDYTRIGAGEGTRKIEAEESDEYEFKYKVTLHRGEDALTFADWKNGGAGAISSLSDFHKQNTPGGTRKDIDWKKHITINLIQKPHGDSGADLLTIAHGEAYGHGAKRGECTINDYATLENPFTANIDVKYLAYAGKDVGGRINTDTETYDASNPTHRFSGSDRWKPYDKDTGNMTDQSIQYSFYPYVMMRYDTQNMSNFTRDNTTYVLGQYLRGMKLNDFAEFMWNDPGSLTNPNLTLYSDQWTTHATVQDDIANSVISDGLGTTTALPGGAILKMKIPEPDEKVVECVTFQCKLAEDSEAYTADGQGGQTQVDKTGSEIASQTLDDIKSNHEDYVRSVYDSINVFKVDQYVNKNSQANPFNGKYVFNGADISSLGTTTGSSAKYASSEEKYYVKPDAASGDSPVSQESDLDVNVADYSSGHAVTPADDILGNTDIQKYTFWADVKGNIWMNNELCLSQSEFGHDQIHSSTAKKIDTRTGVVVKMAEALERNTGYDTNATWKAPHWYNEAFDGVTVVVCSTKLRVGYKYPFERSEVLDPKLVPKAQTDHEGGQGYIGDVNSDRKKNYLVSAFRTEKDPGQSGVNDLVGTFKSVSVISRDLETFYVTKKFFIPAMTTQDLR